MLFGTLRPAYIIPALFVISQPLLIEGCVPARLDNSNGLVSPLELVPSVAVNTISSPVPAPSESPVANHNSIPSLASAFQNIKLWTYSLEGVQSSSGTALMSIVDITNDIATVFVFESGSLNSPAVFKFKLTGEYVSSSGQVLPPNSVTSEMLKAPAGTFTCTKVSYDVNTTTEVVKMAYWIDSEIGIVKLVFDGKKISDQYSTISTLILKYVERKVENR